MHFFLIVAGIVFLMAGIMLRWKIAPSREPEVKSDIDEPAAIPLEPITGPSPYWVMGREFENYVIQRFKEKKKWFKVLDQRHDQLDPDGCPYPSNGNPDLEVEAIWWVNRKEKFAVECKFRSNWYNDSIEWCQAHNLENYRNFAADRNMPVFVVLGVGGEPSAPKEMFCFKITAGTSTKVTRQEVCSLKQPRWPGFYYNFHSHQLQCTRVQPLPPKAVTEPTIGKAAQAKSVIHTNVMPLGTSSSMVIADKDRSVVSRWRNFYVNMKTPLLGNSILTVGLVMIVVGLIYPQFGITKITLETPLVNETTSFTAQTATTDIVNQAVKPWARSNLTKGQSPLKQTTASAAITQVVQAAAPAAANAPVCPDTLQPSERKGCLYEEWVKERFDKRVFSAEIWNKSGSLDNTLTGSIIPDFYYKVATETKQTYFHVECVYRSSAFNGEISWGSDEKVAGLNEYARNSDVPVFLILGLGGQPDQPEKVWIIKITGNTPGKYALAQLPKARVNPEADFKFDSVTKNLY